MTELLTIAEVAARLKLSRRTVYREMAEGRIRFTTIRGRRLVRLTELEAYIAAAFRAA